MHDDLIRWHIARLAEGSETAARRLTASAQDCWPGGLADRSEPVARGWLRLWRPARSAGMVPRCSCAAGHCAVCN
jgi:hypothetical protein